MNDDRTDRLLEEIRDLLQRQVNNSERALANQTESIDKQRHAVELYRRVLRGAVIVTIPLFALIGILLYWLWRSPYFP